MSEERKPVMCPWCGELIPASQWNARYDAAKGTVSCRLWCTCGAHTPWGMYCGDRKQAIEAAYLAATRTPPNLPLTLPELFGLDGDSDAVWIVTDAFTAYDVIVMSAGAACEWASDADTALFFASKPTPADIEAARAEKGRD